MKVEISGTRTEVTLEGNIIEIMLDLAEMKATTNDGLKMLIAVNRDNKDNQIVEKKDYIAETGIEKGYVIRPLMCDFILVLILLDNGEYMVNCHRDTNSPIYLKLYNFCNGIGR